MKRWFSLALVLAMCLTAVLGDIPTAFADEALAYEFEENELSTEDNEGEFSQENIIEEVVGADGSVVPQADDNALPDPDPSEEASELPQADETQGTLDDSDCDIFGGASDDMTDVSGDPEDAAVPELWYARANASLTLAQDEAVSRNIPSGSILLVTTQFGAPMLHVVCENLSGDVDASLLEALTAEEVQGFMDSMTEIEVTLYEGMADYPLPPGPAETPMEPTEVDETERVDAPKETEDTPDEKAGNPEETAEGGSVEQAESQEDEDGEAAEPSPTPEATEAPEDGGETEPKDEDAAQAEPIKAGEAAESGTETAETATNPAEGESAASESASAQAIPETAAPETAAESAPAEAGTPASIALSASSLTLGVKESYTGLTAAIVDANGTAVEGPAIGWRSSNTNVVKVTAEGKLTAVRSGKATVIASAEGLPEATVTVIVKKAPTKISVKPKSGKLSIGMGLQLTATLSKGSASGKLTYTSSNPGVATVDENGLVAGVGLGKATITVRTYNGKKAKCKVTVFSEPASLTTDKTEYAILQGVNEKMTISVLDASGIKTYANLAVVSSDPNVLSIDSNGKMVGVSIGTVTVTISTHNGLSTTCTVDVADQAADMTLSADTINIGVKEKYERLTYTLIPPAGQEKCAATITWKSKNKKIAKVNKKTGVITGVKAGTTTIVATTNNGISRSVKVVVKKAPSSVALSPKTLALTPGMTGQLVASYNAKNVSDNMTYASSDPGVATVNENGLVTAVGRGTATITATTYNGKTDTCTVNSYNDPAQVMVSETLSVAVGARAQLECSVVDADGQPSAASYTYTVIPETGNVEVDAQGRVTGVSVGTARVKVSAHNGVSTHLDPAGLPIDTECYITVTDAAPIRYRVFAVYDFYNVFEKGSLTFPRNNATSFMEVFSKANVDGNKYENVGLLENPSKQALLSGIASAFSDSRDTDVSVVYLCSHGTNYVDVPKTAGSTHYGLQLPGYSNYKSSSDYYITSEEIYDAISDIRGTVILVLDSCYSGQFITNMRSALDSAGGRISVMTAATNTTACYYNIANTNTACDFFTMYLLIGAGYNMRTHTDSDMYPADANQDGKLTFSELFNYAKSNVKTNVPKYKSKSWFHGNYKQSPNVYTGNNGDLVLYQYS